MNRSVQTLMTQAVDYAGLFPPASLSLADAMRNYYSYIKGPDAWMLGRFILPAARLPEFAALIAADDCAVAHRRWSLSLLASPDRDADLAAIESFCSDVVSIGALELRAVSAQQVEELLSAYPVGLIRFVECPPEGLPQILPVLKKHNACAKIRTGGVTAGDIPSPETVAGFLLACAQAGVASKATAGLHHALRGEYPLTYEPGAPAATMHGFLNILAASLLARAQAPESELVAALCSSASSDFAFTSDAFCWRQHCFSLSEIQTVRQQGFLSFGSCSFLEPVETLACLTQENA